MLVLGTFIAACSCGFILGPLIKVFSYILQLMSFLSRHSVMAASTSSIWHRFILPHPPSEWLKIVFLRWLKLNFRNLFGCWNLTHHLIRQSQFFFKPKMGCRILKWVPTSHQVWIGIRKSFLLDRNKSFQEQKKNANRNLFRIWAY